jgi:hypothetical protein
METALQLKTILLSLALATSLPTFGQEPDKRTPLERYEADTRFTLYMCKMTLKLALAKSELGKEQDEQSDWSACIRNGKATAKASFEKALPTVKKAKAKEALKSYQVAFLAAADGIAPGPEERRISYDQRQQMLEGRVTEAWARFEVEK